jgi:cell division protein FtsZ
MSEMGMAMMGTGVGTGENRAREAAEAAISSPLLEDIDLNGAKGVLVNITAGKDMSIGEFEAVGDTIKRFATENATVVVGTVVDPEMTDELRVTVVVTGLGQIGGDRGGAQSASADLLSPVTPPVAETTRSDGSFNYQQLEKPTVIRNQATNNKPSSELNSEDVEFLDIPAFLRRQGETER